MDSDRRFESLGTEPVTGTGAAACDHHRRAVEEVCWAAVELEGEGTEHHADARGRHRRAGQPLYM